MRKRLGFVPSLSDPREPDHHPPFFFSLPTTTKQLVGKVFVINKCFQLSNVRHFRTQYIIHDFLSQDVLPLGTCMSITFI